MKILKNKWNAIRAEVRRHGIYVSVAYQWVGPLKFNGSDVLTAQEFSNVFQSIDRRTVADVPALSTVDGVKKILMLNLLRTEIFGRLYKPALVQVSMGLVALGLATYVLQLLVLRQGG